jgi:hypothetical protein
MTLCSSLLAAGRPVALGSFPPFPKQKGQGQHPAGLLLTSHRAHKSSARVVVLDLQSAASRSSIF